jgi:hypothetical protein
MSEIDHLTVLPQEEVIWGAGALIAVLKGLNAKGIWRLQVMCNKVEMSRFVQS